MTRRQHDADIEIAYFECVPISEEPVEICLWLESPWRIVEILPKCHDFVGFFRR